MVLTNEEIARRLDRFGPPQHLIREPLFSRWDTPDLLRLLRSRLSCRVHWVACETGLSEATVRKVLRSLMALRPSAPEGFE